jgi:hypothetical protein
MTMAADNDQCVFFWWIASTVRHLGIAEHIHLLTLPVSDSQATWGPEEAVFSLKLPAMSPGLIEIGDFAA